MKDWLSDLSLKRAARFGVGVLAVAVALFSLLPGVYRRHTGILSYRMEHAMAYLLLGSVTAIAAQQTQKVNRVALAIVAYAGVLELVQLLIPSRVASIQDLVASAIGAILDMLITALALR